MYGLDVLLGAVVPILVLSYLSDPLGAVPAYLLSALVPVGWVLTDLALVSKRFNFITAFLGLTAIVRGLPSRVRGCITSAWTTRSRA